MKKATRAWVRKAEDDYLAARRLGRGKKPLHDQCCFHHQPCAEKYLKALLEELGLTVPHTHVLKDILTLLRPHHPSLAPLRSGLPFLTQFAVGTRYPGRNAGKRQSQAALRWAGRVRGACRSLLGIKPPRRRKK